MATAASRRLATAALSAAVLVPSGVLLAAPGFADSATPTAGIGEAIHIEASSAPLPGQYVPATESSPATPGWITGGTLQEGTEPQPVRKPGTVSRPQVVEEPAAAPARVTQPVAVQAPARVTQPTAVQGPVRRASVGGSTAEATAGEPTALPFTGPGRLEAQTAAGAVLVLLGFFVMVAGRPRRTR